MKFSNVALRYNVMRSKRKSECVLSSSVVLKIESDQQRALQLNG